MSVHRPLVSMLSLYLSLYGVCGGGAIASAIADEPQAGTEQRPITIVTLGDSITKGVRTGVAPDQTFAAQVENRLLQSGIAARVINVGIGGERTDQALKRLDQIVQATDASHRSAGDRSRVVRKPDVVTVMYGTNDSYVDTGSTASRITIEEYRSNLQRIVAELLRRGILPILMTAPRWSDDAPMNGLGENPNVRLEPYVVACRETAATWRVPLIDHFAAWTDAAKSGVNLREWTTDGCHPNSTGHQQMTEFMLPILRHATGPELKIRKKLLSGEATRVICFGDSVTGVYYHTGSRRAYPDMLGIALQQLAPSAKIEILNAGISGNTTENALARIDRDVISQRPDLVTVMFGLNDMTRVPLATYRENLKKIVQRCQAAGSEVILATPNNVVTTSDRPTEKLIQYCDAMREVGNELNVPVCDVYRELEAVRELAANDWQLLMSDAIHPNMAGHKQIATCLAQSITGQRALLEKIPVPPNPVEKTLTRLREGQPVRILAMPPYHEWIAQTMRSAAPASSQSEIIVELWPTENLTLSELEESAKKRVRAFKPDLVLIAVPRSASADSDQAFAKSYAWVMNWSLNFGPPTWDTVVIHPAVTEPVSSPTARDDLIRRLVSAQDLSLIDRPADSTAPAQKLLQAWFQQFAQP